jgi:pimeloyl-ACP methyl ester carboxylesterase
VTTTTTGTQPVPGATLYYKLRGVGPLLLILQGGDGTADSSDALADRLVDYYTVLTYDRRGLSRSTIVEGTTPPNIQTHGDDAHQLLKGLTSELALVLGNSIGAVIGLDLASRYPWQVHTLIVHEPPALDLLPDDERAAVVLSQKQIEETRRNSGAQEAMQQSLALLRLDFTDREPDVVLASPSPDRAANLKFFQTYDAPAVHRYTVDIGALAAATTRIVPAGGCTSRGIWPYRVAEILAERLGTDLVEFPGGHNGFVLHPRAFATRLLEVFGE